MQSFPEIWSLGSMTQKAEQYFQNIIFDDVGHLTDSILNYHSNRASKDAERILEGRRDIAQFSTSYLRKIDFMLPKDSAREGILEQINLLKDSPPEETIILMSAHQPNLFAYAGILRKIALLKAIEDRISKLTKKPKGIVCLFGIADHDFVRDKWVRSAEMSAPLRREGVLRFNIDIDQKDLFLPSNRIKKPSLETLESWRTQILGWISENSSLATKYARSNNFGLAKSISEIATQNFREFWNYVEQAQTKATNSAEFSSFLLAIIVNVIWNAPVVFVNFSDCFTKLGKEYQWLISNVRDYSYTIQQNEITLKAIGVNSGLSRDITTLLPIWIKCSCGSKHKVFFSKAMNFSGKCMRCKSELEYTNVQLMDLLQSSPELFEPRSISMPLAFAKAIDMSCFVGGKGGIGYIMHSEAISKKLGSPFPPTPVWDVTDSYVGIERLASTCEAQRISTSYKLNLLDNSPHTIVESANCVSIELNAKMKEGLIPKTSVTERERQLLEKIPKSLQTKMCSVGYAINIGLRSTYEQWLEFLAKDGKLQDPVELRSILA